MVATLCLDTPTFMKDVLEKVNWIFFISLIKNSTNIYYNCAEETFLEITGIIWEFPPGGIENKLTQSSKTRVQTESGKIVLNII